MREGFLKLSLLTLSLLLSLVAVEILLRVIYPVTTGYYVWQPDMQYTFSPDTSIFYGVSGEKHFTINKDGCRGDRFTDSTLNYLCIGGSTTECLYLDDKETWWAYLQRGLNERPGTRFVIASIGKSGITTREHYVQMKYCLPQLKNLHGVIIMAGINDLMKRLSRDSSAERNFVFTPNREDSLVANTLLISDYNKESKWYRRTAIFKLLQNAYHHFFPTDSKEMIENNSGDIYATWRENRRKASTMIDSLPDMSWALDEYERNLQLIYEEAKKQHLTIVFINQAAMYTDTMSAYENSLLWMGGTGQYQVEGGHAYYTSLALRKGLKLYNERLAQFCDKRNIQCVDIASYLPRDTSVFYDDCHFNE